MSHPGSLTLNIPATFQSSFWSAPDYRKGLEALYSRLQAGIDEDTSVLSLVDHRANLEFEYAEKLATPSPLPSHTAPLFKGFLTSGVSDAARNFAAGDSAASHAFRTLEAEATTAQSAAHSRVARNLEKTITIPFGKWSEDHKKRVQASWEHLDATVEWYERQWQDTDKLQQKYGQKCRQADEAEDDARFAGGEHSGDEAFMHASSSSPTLPALPEKEANHDEKEEAEEHDEKVETDPERLKRRETLRQQFGFRRANAAANAAAKAEGDKFTPLSPRSISAQISSPTSERSEDKEQLLGGLKRSVTLSSALSSALSKASVNPTVQNLRAAVGGLSEPRHLRLRREAEQAEQAYKEAVRNLDKLRCRTEETLAEHFKLAERWEAERLRAIKSVLAAFNAAFEPLLPMTHSSLQRCAALEPALDPLAGLQHVMADSRTGPYRPVAQVFHPYYHDDSSTLMGAGSGGFGMNLRAYMRAEALLVEDGEGSEALRTSAFLGSKSGLPALPLTLSALLAALERQYNDASRWPKARITTTAEGEAKEAEDEKSLTVRVNEEKRKSWIYEVPLSASHACREAIISHLGGSSVPGADVGAGLDSKLSRFDTPTLAATVKLWCLELVDSLISSELWMDVINAYAAAQGQEREARIKAAEKEKKEQAEAGKDDEETPDTPTEATPKKDKGKARERAPGTGSDLDPAVEEKIRKGVLEDLGVILSKLPKIHLVCLDALLGHLSKLIKTTPTEEPDLAFLHKLGLSLAPVFIRPLVETPHTMWTKSPALMTIDLIKYYDELLPTVTDRKAKESEAVAAQRRTPIRKRTKPVDQRLSRSKMAASAGHDVPMLPPKDGSIGMAASPTDLMTQGLPDGASGRPTVATRGAKEAAQAATAGDEEAPTPLADRVLQSTTSNNLKAPERVTSPSSASGGSAYDTPGESDDEVKKAAPATSHAASSSAGEDTPTSNVARLSRQFGSMGSGRSNVRGPRAAGSRPTSTVAPSSAQLTKRESRDLAPSTDSADKTPSKSERRRSWSRTMESSDALVDNE